MNTIKKIHSVAVIILLISPFSAYPNCSKLLQSTTPNNQFDMSTDGVIIDVLHKLVWTRCSAGQQFVNNSCVGAASKFKWLDAINYSNEYAYLGYKDWRLPNKNELNSIVELACSMPSVNEAAFPNTASSSYWSSSPYDDAEGFIWTIDFSNANIFTMDATKHAAIRLVRSL